MKYAITFGVFFAIDIFWLGLVAPKFYSNQLGGLMTDQVKWGAAILFYVLYIAALLILVINPALKLGSVKMALLNGALFGLVAYATYDLTNYATLKNWPLLMTIVDLIWGTFITSTTAAISTKLILFFNLYK